MVFIFPVSWASLMSAVMGSAPGVSTKMSGVLLRLSAKASMRLSWGGSMNLVPISLATKSWISGTTQSGRTHRRMQMSAKGSSVMGAARALMSAAGVLDSKRACHFSG